MALAAQLQKRFSENCPTPMARIGTQDVFGESGTPAELLKKYHMTAEDIVLAAKQTIQKKRS